MKEHMIHIWGGAWNHNADPSIEKDLGIKEGYYYFKTEKELNDFIDKINNPIYNNQGIARDIKYGEMTHKRTIFVGTFEYKNKQYILHYDFGYEYKTKDAEFMFLDGNYSCDCNRSIFIREEYGNVIPELDCGDEIKLIDYHFDFLD